MEKQPFSNTLDEQRRVLCGKWLKEALLDLDLPGQNQLLIDDDTGFEPYKNIIVGDHDSN